MNRVIFKRVLSLVAAIMVYGAACAQDQALLLSRTEMTVAEALAQIHNQTGMGVAYNTEQVDPNRTVAFPSLSMTVDEVVKTIVEGTGVTHTYEDRMVLFSKAPESQQAPEPVVEKSVSQEMLDHSAPQGTRPAPVVDAAPALAVVPALAPVPVSKYRPISDYAQNQGHLPSFAMKTNLLYGLGTLTPNLSMEFGLGMHTSLEVGASYNPWNLKGSLESNRKLVHMIIKPEFRYWTCERFTGHFFGAHAIYGRYNIGTYEVPALFEKEYRYNGYAVGGGITYGYSLPFAKRWSVEFAVGVGALWLSYDRFDCAACDSDPTPMTKTYFGPTNASISLVFFIK